MKEAELRPAVVRHLESLGYRVWIAPDGRDYLDVVAERHGEIGLVELKVSDWKTVRAQAVRRRAFADWIAVVLPRESLARRLIDSSRGPFATRVGVWVATDGRIEELRAPRPLRDPGSPDPFEEARRRFTQTVEAAAEGIIPEGVAWGPPSLAQGDGRERRRDYRLDEFDEPAGARNSESRTTKRSGEKPSA